MRAPVIRSAGAERMVIAVEFVNVAPTISCRAAAGNGQRAAQCHIRKSNRPGCEDVHQNRIAGSGRELIRERCAGGIGEDRKRSAGEHHAPRAKRGAVGDLERAAGQRRAQGVEVWRCESKRAVARLDDSAICQLRPHRHVHRRSAVVDRKGSRRGAQITLANDLSCRRQSRCDKAASTGSIEADISRQVHPAGRHARLDGDPGAGVASQ